MINCKVSGADNELSGVQGRVERSPPTEVVRGALWKGRQCNGGGVRRGRGHARR